MNCYYHSRGLTSQLQSCLNTRIIIEAEEEELRNGGSVGLRLCRVVSPQKLCVRCMSAKTNESDISMRNNDHVGDSLTPS